MLIVATTASERNGIMICMCRPKWVPLQLRELPRYQDLFCFLIWRDLKVCYKQTALGFSWAIIPPLMAMLVFSVVFGRLGKIPSDGIPYPIFSYAALVPWTFFSNGLTTAANSLVDHGNIIKKVYLPRLLLPVARVSSGIIDFFVAFIVLLIMMWFYGIVPTQNIVWLPFLLLLAYITALGPALWLSAINAEYRDVRHAVPFFVQFWMFASPIAYPGSLLPEPWSTIYGLNPMAGVSSELHGKKWLAT